MKSARRLERAYRCIVDEFNAAEWISGHFDAPETRELLAVLDVVKWAQGKHVVMTPEQMVGNCLSRLKERLGK